MKYLPWAAIAVVVATIVAALYLAGSPQTARSLRFDERRLGDMQNLQAQIFSYWTQEKALPTTLADLSNVQPGFMVPTDPETSQPYQYRQLTSLEYSLCATYALPTDATSSTYAYPIYQDPYYLEAVDWKHAAGQTCYTRTIDKAKYDKDQQAMINNNAPSTVPPAVQPPLKPVAAN